MRRLILPIVLMNAAISGSAFAQTTPARGEVLAADFNANGALEIIAFGDSITRGMGDFIPAGETVESGSLPEPAGEAGYPRRVENLAHIGVLNRGVSGEELVQTGLRRFASLIPSSRPDLVLIEEGANDAIRLRSSSELFYAYQTLANIAYASGVKAAFITTPTPCCEHFGYIPEINSFNRELRSVASLNGIPVIDVAQGYRNICRGSEECSLLNLPEGLHPNQSGYDIMGEMVIGALLGFDLLVPGARELLETALGLPSGTLHTEPNAV